MINIGVVGSRKYNDSIGVKLIVDAIPVAFYPREVCIVSGGAVGVDTWAIEEAQELELDYDVFPADWKRYGKKAGMLRNIELVDYCHYLLIFWDGMSPGTKGTIAYAKKTNTKYKLIGV